MKTRILLVDDHKIVREGLRALLDSQDEFEVISEASDGRTAVRLALEKKPDIVLMDIAMPQLNGIEATRQIVSAKSSSKVIALSMHLDKEWVSEVFLAGASGYLLKDCEFEELKRAIKTVLLNRYYLSPDVADDVIKDYIGARLERIAGAPTLSAREREVVQLISEGKSSKEIAELLNISVRTVENHRRQIMEKLNIHTIAGLTKYAIRQGITSLEE